MSFTITYKIKLIILISISGLGFSCINENLPSCIIDPNPEPCEVRLSFDYHEKDGMIGFDPQEVKSLQIFVFDENNKYIETFIDNFPQIANEDYFSRISLEPGKYSLIVFGNLEDCYSTEPQNFEKGITSLNEISYYFNDIISDTIVSHPEHLFFASASNIILSKSIDHFTLPLVRNTYVINFTVEGLPNHDENYRFVITDSNGRYRFDNTFLSDKELHYIQECHYVEEQIQHKVKFTCLRLAKDRNPQLKLFNKQSGELLYEDSLMSLLLKMEDHGIDVDFSKMYEFDIHLLFEKDPISGSLILEIYINGWNVVEKEVEIELGKR